MIQIDMEMPRNCMECMIRTAGLCGLVCDFVIMPDNKDFKHPKCPLKELKECEAEDCISRTEAIEMFANTEDADSCKWTTKGIIAELNDLPSVYPKSDKPSAKWISHGEHCKQLGVLPSGLGSFWWCSNCETGIESTQFHRVEYNYCPKCGAKMGEE